MVKLLEARFDGYARFALSGVHADQFVALLQLPLERTRTDAGIIVTILPEDLTNGTTIERFREEREADCLEGDLFSTCSSDREGAL